MPMFKREDIDLIKQRANLEDVIPSYGVALKGSGSSLVGLCPFHNEKTGSFHVRPDYGVWRCFGCGESGDVFSFVTQKENISFSEAVEMLAERYSVDLHVDESPENKEKSHRKQRLHELMKLIAAFYHHNFLQLPETHPARQELAKRNLEVIPDRKNWLEEFGIGWAPESGNATLNYALAHQYTHEDLLDAGLARRSESGRIYDCFRGRLTWEIRDIQGRPIGFGARKVFETDSGSKYLNSPQTVLYDKSQVLYGIDLARKEAYSKHQLIVVEGYTDVMALAAVGITNVVAPCGTAFGDEHARIALRLIGETGKILFNFDGDSAGQKAALHTFSLKTPLHTMSSVTRMMNGDPCDIRMQYGDEKLKELVSEKNSIPLTKFVLETEKSKYNLAIPEERSMFLRASAPLLSEIPDYATREEYVRQLSFWTGMGTNIVRNALKYTPLSKDSYPTYTQPEKTGSTATEKQPQRKLTAQEKWEIHFLSTVFQYGYNYVRIQEAGDVDLFTSDTLLSMYSRMVSFYSTHDKGVYPIPSSRDDNGALYIFIASRDLGVEGDTPQDTHKNVERVIAACRQAIRALNATQESEDIVSRARMSLAEQYDEAKTGDLSILQALQDERSKRRAQR